MINIIPKYYSTNLAFARETKDEDLQKIVSGKPKKGNSFSSLPKYIPLSQPLNLIVEDLRMRQKISRFMSF